MSVIEIVGGAILLVASLVIVFLTLMQHTHGLPQQGGQQCPELAGLQPDGGRSQEEQGEKYYGNAR